MDISRNVVKLDDILLDPQNPRFIDFKEYTEFPSDKFAEIQVQKQTVKLLDQHFDVKKIKDSILNNGYINVDQIVVKVYEELDEIERYIVVEGNRRICACKLIMEDANIYSITHPAVIKQISELYES